MDQILLNVIASAAWQGIVSVYERVVNKSLEEMYLIAFDKSVDSLRNYLSEYANDQAIQIDKDRLRDIFHQDVREDLAKATISGQATPEFHSRLVSAMSQGRIVEFDSDNLSDAGYQKVVSTVIQQAHGLFQDVVVKNKDAFNRVVLNELSSIHLKLDQSHIQLNDISSRMEAVRENTVRRQPALTVGFVSNHELLAKLIINPKVLPEGGPTDEEIEVRLAERIQLIHRTAAEARVKYTKAPQFSLAYRPVTDEEIEDYEQECLDLIPVFRALLKAKRSREHGQRIFLSTAVINKGQVVASGIRIELRFPEGTYLIPRKELGAESLDDLRNWDLPEDLHRPPWEADPNDWIREEFMSRVRQSPQPSSRFWIDRETRGMAVVELDKLLTGGHAQQPTLACYLPREISKEVPVNYSIWAEELAQPIQGTISILLHEEANSHDESSTGERT